MKIQPNRLCLVLGLGLLTGTSVALFTGCASGHHNPGHDEYAGDRAVRLRVATALGDNPEYKFEGVSVTVSNGVVRLGGLVDLFPQKVKAGDIVMQVPGVKNVEDYIAVREQIAFSTGKSVGDESLTEEVKNVLGASPDYKYDEVNVATSQGTVQLGGFVNTAEQKKRAGDVARTIPGVKDVLNNITVKGQL